VGFEQDNTYPVVDPPLELSDLSGGFRYSESLFDIEINQSPECRNVYYRDGALWKMDGTDKMNSVVVSGAPDMNGLFNYGQESSGVNRTLVMASGNVFHFTTGAGMTDVTGSVSVSGRHFGLVTNDIFIGVTSERNAPYKKNGASNLAALGGSPPSGRVLGKIGQFPVIANTAANPNRAYYPTDPGNIEGEWIRFFEVGSDDTQGITAVAAVDSRSGYIFKERTADRIIHLGGLSFQHDRNYLPVGVVAQASLKKCTMLVGGRAVDILVGLADSGVYAFDSSKNPFKISKNIDFKFDRNNGQAWNRSHWSKAVAEYDPTRNWYWLFAPSAQSAGEMDELWICDLDTLAWWPCDPGAAASIGLINDANDRPQIHVGGYDGFVRRFSRTNLNYDGTAVNAYWASKAIDFKSTVRVRQFVPYAKEVGNWNLDFQFRWGLVRTTTASDSMSMLGSGGVYGTGVYGTALYGGTQTIYKNVDGLNRTGRYLQVVVRNNRSDETFNLYKMEFPGLRWIGGRPSEYR